MPTPINNKVRRGAVKRNKDDFHAGHILRSLLQEQGHDVPWLAAQTGYDVTMLEALLDQPNMDAMLFVRLGMPMQPQFMQRIDEMIFGKRTADELK